MKLSKCQFFQDENRAHNLTRRSQADKGKGGQYTVCKESKKQEELKSFIDLMTYNVKFLPAITSVLHLLLLLAKEERKMVMGEEEQACLQKGERAIVSKAPVLANYSVDFPIKVYCDAGSIPDARHRSAEENQWHTLSGC